MLNGVILGINAVYSRRGFAPVEHLTVGQKAAIGIILGKLARMATRFYCWGQACFSKSDWAT